MAKAPAKRPGRKRRPCDRNTPEDVLDVFRQVGQIALDPCSNPWSLVRARVEFSAHRGEDGLAAAWHPHVLPGEVAYVNPEYTAGEIPKWMEKANKEARYFNGIGAGIVFLVPADCSTGHYQTGWRTANAVLKWGRRVEFIGGGSGNMWPSVSWFWGPPQLMYRFCYYAEPHGIVEVLRRAPV